MTKLLNKILFGANRADSHEGVPPELRRFLLFASALAVLVLARVCLPFRPCESQDLYDAIGWALLNEQNWGKQAIAGVLEYAPLPAVAQLVATPLELLRRIGVPFPPAGHLIVAIAQVWVLVLTIRIAQLLFSKRVGIAVGSLLFVIVALGHPAQGQDGWVSFYVLTGSPFWVCAVPLAGVIYHVLRWERDSKIRDIVFIGLNCGVLVFCGLAGIAFAGMTLALLIARGRIPAGKWRGIVLLLTMPFIYSLLLLLLFNYLVMNDALFALRRLAAYFGGDSFWGSIHREARLVSMVAVLVAAAIGMIIPGLALRDRLAWQLAGAVGICHAIQHGGNIFVGGTYLLAGFAAVPALLSVASLSREGKLLQRVIPAAVGLLLIAGIVQLRRDSLQPEAFQDSGAPTRQELIGYVDEEWEGSRILVYGLRPAAMYARANPEEAKLAKRFVARIDFNEYVLKEDIEAEQFHLLVPPDNGRYYPRHHRIFREVHQASIPEWLFLEKTWVSKQGGGGYWELWRCVRARPEPVAAGK